MNMRKALLLLLAAIVSIPLMAQQHVFVLMDASKSVTSQQLDDARQALTDIFMGAAPSKGFVSHGSQQDLLTFRLKQGDRLAVSRFGSLNTTQSILPQPVTMQNVNADVYKAMGNVSWVPTDGQTYITLAKAKIAEYAKRNNISQYRLVLVSDNIQDDYGPGGKPNYTDPYIRDLVEGYNTSTNPVSESGYTKFKFNPNSDFTISLSPKVDVSKYNLPKSGGAVTPPPSTSINEPAAIQLTSFADGKKDKPKDAKSGDLTISWACPKCPAGAKFNVLITSVDGSNAKENKKNLSGNSAKFTGMPSGTYKVVVSSTEANSATTYVKVPGGGLGWLLVLLLLAAGAVVVIVLYRRKRRATLEESGSQSQEPIFRPVTPPSSKDTGSAPPPANNDYF
jgi:hypothetical protein